LPCFTTTNEGKGGPDSIPKKSLTTNFHCKGTGKVLRPINGNVNVNVNIDGGLVIADSSGYNGHGPVQIYNNRTEYAPIMHPED
jgi:hypothetical protein